MFATIEEFVNNLTTVEEGLATEKCIAIFSADARVQKHEFLSVYDPIHSVVENGKAYVACELRRKLTSYRSTAISIKHIIHDEWESVINFFNQIQSKKDENTPKNLKWWEEIESLVGTEPDPKAALWYYTHAGNVGRTTFINSIKNHQGWIGLAYNDLPSIYSDIANQCSDGKVKGIIIECDTIGSFREYRALEELVGNIKDGYIQFINNVVEVKPVHLVFLSTVRPLECLYDERLVRLSHIG